MSTYRQILCHFSEPISVDSLFTVVIVLIHHIERGQFENQHSQSKDIPFGRVIVLSQILANVLNGNINTVSCSGGR